MTNIGMKILDTRAALMTRACKDGAVNAQSATINFFKYANERHLPNQALVAYYNQANSLKGYSPKQLSADIYEMAAKNDNLKGELNKFAKMVNGVYPKSIGDRVSLLSNGAVVPDRVKPQNFFVKMFSAISKVIREVEE